MTSYAGAGRLVGGAASPIDEQVLVNLDDIDGHGSRRRFRGWLRLSRASAQAVLGLDGLCLELPGGKRFPVTLGGADDRGRIAVIGEGRVPPRVA